MNQLGVVRGLFRGLQSGLGGNVEEVDLLHAAAAHLPQWLSFVAFDAPFSARKAAIQ